MKPLKFKHFALMDMFPLGLLSASLKRIFETTNSLLTIQRPGNQLYKIKHIYHHNTSITIACQLVRALWEWMVVGDLKVGVQHNTCEEAALKSTFFAGFQFFRI